MSLQMPLSPIFKIREIVNPQIIHLLEQTTLGTNGAMYKHLDTSKRIHEADNPLFLSMERNDKVIGNITFCRRNQDWYIRYFAFNSMFQSGPTKRKTENTNSLLKQELNQFFSDTFSGITDGTSVHSMYAYIDPNNERSIWMSQNFGFRTIGELSTQSFSRIKPKKSDRLSQTNDWNMISAIVRENYSDHQYYFETHSSKPPFWLLKDDSGKVIACARTTKVNWEIIRLPGKFGKMLTKIIPYLPGLNKLIRPKHHTFLVPEIVCLVKNDPLLLEELFSGILHEEKLNLILWWIDKNDPLYAKIRTKIKWGLLHKIIGNTPVNVVQKTLTDDQIINKKPIFVTAFDMV